MSKVFKFFFKAIAGLAGLVCTVLAVRFVLVCREPEIIPIEIGEVHFTDKYNPEARLLIPVNGNGKCTDFGNRECSDFGNSNAPISVTTIHNFR